MALIEKSARMYGGTCINEGCIPSKKIIEMAQESSLLDKKDRYPEVIAEKNQLVSFLREKNYAMLNDLEEVRIIDGEASFISPHKLKVKTSDGELILEGEKILINTGSKAQRMQISGLEDSDLIYTSAELMNLETLPKRLVIFGAGYIGLEFASMYADLGSQVTLINKHADILTNEEPEIVELIKQEFTKKGIQIYNEAQVLSGKKGENAGLRLQVKSGSQELEISADAVLLAMGRAPNTENLNVEDIGIELDSKGAIKVNDRLQTSVPHIWAIGDVNGGPQFTYISLDDARIIRDQRYGAQSRSRTDR